MEFVECFTAEELRQVVATADVIVTQGDALNNYPFLAQAGAVLALDMYDPLVFENLEYERVATVAAGDARIAHDVVKLNGMLDVLAERIEQAKAGIVVPAGDATSMADAIRTLARDDERRHKCAARSQALADE